MSKGLSLERRECARNSGIFLVIRLLLGTLLFLALNSIYYVFDDNMLTAAEVIKVNILFVIAIIAVLFFFSLISFIVAIPLNNVFKTVNSRISISAAALRIIELILFVGGILILFAGEVFYFQLVLVNLFLYGSYLILIGYLVITSGYLNRLLGLTLIIGGTMGYLFQIVTNSIFADLKWISTIGIIIAILSEFILAIALIQASKKVVLDTEDSRQRVIRILTEFGEATTREIINEATKTSDGCKDRVPKTLTALESEGIVSKRMSKEKKGFVWTLVS